MPDSRRRHKASAAGDSHSSTTTGSRATTRDSHTTHSTRMTRYSESLCDSNSTNPTVYSSARPSRVKTAKAVQHAEAQPINRSYFADVSHNTRILGPRDSVDTYASTVPDRYGLSAAPEEEFIYRQQEIPELPPYRPRNFTPDLVYSDPELFGELFPSMLRLSIQHDDTTTDGNMNLRVDTKARFNGHAMAVTLFHLRMHDLARREFSFRRYCRDSGREICNSKRKYTRAAAADPASGKKKPSRRTSLSSIISSSSSSSKNSSKHGATVLTPTNTIKLEFSNYARLEVERHGSSDRKRYGFQWWEHKYSWARTTDRNTGAVSFHLMRGREADPVAHIVPDVRTPTQQREERRDGVWVPPCHMWIACEAIIGAATDVSDVLVATGLMALVDDCIKERWEKDNKKSKSSSHKSGSSHVSLPLPLMSQRVEVSLGKPASLMKRLLGGSRSRRGSEASSASAHSKGAAAVAMQDGVDHNYHHAAHREKHKSPKADRHGKAKLNR